MQGPRAPAQMGQTGCSQKEHFLPSAGTTMTWESPLPTGAGGLGFLT